MEIVGQFMEKSDKLNLGCGQYCKEDYLNLDVDPNTKADLIHDLNCFPYPFKDNQFSLIEADHVLEHLERPITVMKELHRILKPGGVIIIRVPHFSRGFTNPDHKSGFDVSFPYWFCPRMKPWYVGVEYRLEKMKLSWSAQPYLKKEMFPILYYPLKIIGIILDFLANLCPAFCSRVWCFWMGGFEEIEFILKKPN